MRLLSAALVFVFCASLQFSVNAQEIVASGALKPPAIDDLARDNPTLRKLLSDMEELNDAMNALSPAQEALELLTREADRQAPDLTVLLFAEDGRWQARYAEHSGVATAGGEVVVPLGSSIELRPTSADIIYNMQFETLGLSFEAIPGRINSVVLHADKTGAFEGACSICGSKAQKMMIRVVSQADFAGWLAKKKAEIQ